MQDITIISAFFDIGRGNWHQHKDGRPIPNFLLRSVDHYFQCFENLSILKNDMIIFTSPDLVDRVKKIREKNSPNSLTHVVGFDFQNSNQSLRNEILNIMKNKYFIDFINDPLMPEYWNADYVMINFLKTNFVNLAYELGLVKTELAAWLDFGYARDMKAIPENKYWRYNFNPKKMHYFNCFPADITTPIFEITRTNRVIIMGCAIVGGKIAWENNKRLNNIHLKSLMCCGLVDDDQTIMLMNWRADPTNIELHYVNTEPNGWFVMLTSFNNRDRWYNPFHR